MARFNIQIAFTVQGAGAAQATFKGVGASAQAAHVDIKVFDRGVADLRNNLLALAGITSVGAFFRKIVDETKEAQAAQAQLAAAVLSTGGAAGLTVTQLADLAQQLQRTTAYSDEAVEGAESILLTFTKINGDNFRRATADVLDMATRMGTDAKMAALQLGKALNDPVEGATALRRAGVQLSEQQKTLVKDLVKVGNTAGAQAVILKELETEFGGSAAAARNTLGGALQALDNQMGELFETAGGALAPAIADLAKQLSDLAASGDAAKLFSDIGAAAGEAVKAIGFLVKHLDELKAVLVAYVALRAPIAVAALAAELVTAAKAAELAKVEVFGLNAAMLLSPFGAVVAGLAAVAGALSLMTARYNEAHAAMLGEMAQMSDTRASVDLLAAATHRLTEAEGERIKQQLAGLYASKAQAEADLRAAQASVHGRTGHSMFANPEDRQAIADAKGKIGDLKRQIADLLKAVDEYSKGAYGVVPPTKAFAAAVADLTKGQLKALTALRLLLEAMAEEVRQRGLTLAATIRGGEALEARLRAEAVEKRVVEERLRLEGQKLTLSAQSARQIRDLVGREYDLGKAIDRVNATHARAREILTQASDALAQYGSLSKRVALSTDEQGDAVMALYHAAADLKLQLGGLQQGTALYAETAERAAQADKEWRAAASELPSLQALQQRAINEAAASLAVQITAINDEADALYLSGAAAVAFAREQRLAQAAAEAMAVTVKGEGEAHQEWAARVVAAMNAAREATARVFRAEDFRNITEPINQALESTRSRGLDVFADILTGAKLNFAEIAKDLLRQWVRALEEMLVRWIATQRAMAATRVAGGVAGGGGGGGGIGSLLSSLGGASGLYSSGGTAAGAYGPTASGGNIAAAGGLTAMGWVAAYAAVYLAARQIVRTTGTVVMDATVALNRDSQLALSQVRGSTGLANQALAAAHQMIDQINAIVLDLGGTLESFDPVTISRKGRGKKADWRVIVNGIVEHFGTDAQAAYEAAMVEALKHSTITGLSPLVQAAIKDSTARTVQQIQDTIAFAQRVDSINLPDAGRTVREAFLQFGRDVAQAIATWRQNPALLAQGLGNLGGGLVSTIQGIVDQLLGRTQDAEAIRQRNIDAVNTEIRVQLAALHVKELQLQADIAAAELRNRLVRGTVEGALLIGRAAGMSEEALAALRAQLAAIQDQEAQLAGLLITDDQRKKPLRTGRGGGGDTVASDRDQVRQALDDSARQRMGDMARALAEISHRYDDLIPKAHADARLLGELAAARLAEIAALRQKNQAELLAMVTPANVTNIERARQYFRDLLALPANARPPKWLINLVQGEWLEGATADLDARIASLQGVGTSLAAIQRNADALKQEIMALGLGAEEAARRLAGVDLGAQYQVQTGINGVLDRVFADLKDNAKYAAQSVDFARQKVALEYAVIRAQLDAYGVLAKYAQLINDAEKAAAAAAGGTNTIAADKAQRLADRQQEAMDAAREAADRWADAMKKLEDFVKSLLLDNNLSTLTPAQRLAEAKAQYEDILGKARGGSVEAAAALEQYARQYLTEDRSYNASGGTYRIDFQKVLADVRAIIGAGALAGTSSVPAGTVPGTSLPSTSPTTSALNVRQIVDAVDSHRRQNAGDALAAAGQRDKLQGSIDQLNSNITRLLQRVAA